jgi:hypothetical protein
MKRPVPPLTVDELQCAILAGGRAYDAKTEGEPLAARAPVTLDDAEEAVAASLDSPIISFIVAIDAAFSHDPDKGQAAIERVLLVGRDALRDQRAAPYLRRHSTAMLEVHRSLLEAIATVPLFYGHPSPLDRIFALAEEIRQRLDPISAP